jgi:toxin ParE1/3/4
MSISNWMTSGFTLPNKAAADIADHIVNSITACFVTPGQNPRMGRRRDDDLTTGLRSFPVGHYVIVYCIEEEDAAILHVLHSSRDIESFFCH